MMWITARTGGPGVKSKERVSGVVTSIQYDGDEQMLMVGNEAVRLSDVHSVRTAEPAAGPPLRGRWSRTASV